MDGEDGLPGDGAASFMTCKKTDGCVFTDFGDERAIKARRSSLAVVPASPVQPWNNPQEEPSACRKNAPAASASLATQNPEIRRNSAMISTSLMTPGARHPSEKTGQCCPRSANLKQIEAEERLAAPEEQEVLSRYVGWGACTVLKQTSLTTRS